MFNRAISTHPEDHFSDIKPSLIRTQSLLNYLVQQQLCCNDSDLKAIKQMKDTLTKIDEFLGVSINR